MNTLDRHIRSTVMWSMLVVMAIIVSLDLIFSLLDQFADTDADYTALDALSFVLMTTPTSLYELLPYVALGGAMIGLGMLASQNEVVVMQAAGVRVSRIVLAVLKPVLMLMLFGLMLGEYVSPPLQQLAQSNKAIQQSGSASVAAEQGNWQRIGNEFIHINAIAPGGTQLFGLTRYRIDQQRRLLSTSFAESARYVAQGESGFWRLRSVRESVFDEDRVRSRDYLEQDWQVELSPQLLSVLLVDPDEQSVTGLYRFASFFAAEGLDSGRYYLAFWKKLLQPLSTIALVILAISFVFGPLREATMGARVFIAIAIGLAFTILQRLMEPASLLWGFNPLLAVLTPIFLCALIGLLLIRRVR